MIFSVKLSKKALKRFEKLDHKTRRRIRLKLKEFASDPFSIHDVKKLVGSKEPPLYRLRVGEYRIVFWIDWKENTIFVERIIHRSEGYIFFE